MGCRVAGSGLKVLGFGVWGVGFRVLCVGFGVEGSGVEGLGIRVWGLGFRVQRSTWSCVLSAAVSVELRWTPIWNATPNVPCTHRKVDISLPGKRNSNSHGARPVHSNHLDD